MGVDSPQLRTQRVQAASSEQFIRHGLIVAGYSAVAVLLEFVGHLPMAASGVAHLRPGFAVGVLFILLFGWRYSPLVVGYFLLASVRTPVLGSNVAYVLVGTLLASMVVFVTAFAIRRTWNRGAWGSQLDFVVLGTCGAVLPLATAANQAAFMHAANPDANPFLLAWLAGVIPLATMLPAGIKVADWLALQERPSFIDYFTQSLRPQLVVIQYMALAASAALLWWVVSLGGTGRVFPLLVSAFWISITCGLAGATLAVFIAQAITLFIIPTSTRDAFGVLLASTVMSAAAILAGSLVAARKLAEKALIEQGEALRRQLAEMQVIRRLADSIIALRNASDLYRLGAEAMGEQLDVDQVWILWVPEVGEIEERGSWARTGSPDRDRFAPNFRAPQMTSIWRELERSRKALLSRADRPNALLVEAKVDMPIHYSSGIKSLMLHPFAFHGGGFNVAAILTHDRFRTWTPEEIQFVAAASDQITIAQQKAALLIERDERSRAFSRMTQALLGDVGDAFFRNLVHRLADAAGARGAYCCRIFPGAKTATMLAFADGGRARPVFEFETDGSPLVQTLANGTQAMDDGAGDSFPRLNEVAGFRVRGFTAISLHDSEGQALGTLAVCDDKPLEDSEHVSSVLRLFAARASAEIERSEREKRLRESEASHRRLLETAHEGIWTVDAQGATTFVNATMAAMLGYSTQELIGRRLQDFVEGDDRERVGLELQRELAGAAAQQDIRMTRRDGSQVWTMISMSPIRNADGEFQGALAMITDISQRKQTEQWLDRLVKERTAELTSSNQELEAFCYSVSHDLRQPLRAIDGFSRAAVEDLGEDVPEDVREHLQRVRRAANRMSELIDALLTLSRLSRVELKRERVDLTEIAEGILDEYAKNDPKRSDGFVVRKGLTAIGDARLLHIVLENLLSNAWKFSSRAEHPLVEFGSKRIGERTAFYVRDNGIGFNMAYQNKLFMAFERLHSQTDYSGTGIGLATVKRIVNRHGGRVWAEGEEGKGATFYFEIGTEQ